MTLYAGNLEGLGLGGVRVPKSLGFPCILTHAAAPPSWEQHVNDIHHTSALKAINGGAGVTMSVPQSSTLTPRALLDLPALGITRSEPTTALSKRRTGSGPGDATLDVGGGAGSLAKLPGGWVQLWSKTKCRPYFKNTVTNKCSWTLPSSASSYPLGPGATKTSLHGIINASPSDHWPQQPQWPGDGGLPHDWHGPPGERDEPMDVLDDSPKIILHVNGQCFGHSGALMLTPQEQEQHAEEERGSLNDFQIEKTDDASYSYSCGQDRQQRPAGHAASPAGVLRERVTALESGARQSDMKLAKVLAGQDALALQLRDIQGKLARLLD